MTDKPERIEHILVPEMESILGKSIRVLDDGFVRLIDYMGSDSAIVQSARVSYGTGTSRIHEDRGLIRYLMRHSHTTPFEMCEVKLHVRVPMDCWRQWIRHRTANVNEYSTRYSVAIDAVQRTNPSEWRIQSDLNRQGSQGHIDQALGKELSNEEEAVEQHARKVYEHRLQVGVAREQARKDLPLSTYTEAYWKIDLHNLFHFLSLRMAATAQFEIRSYANVIGNEIVRKWCPLSWEAFVDYRLKTLNLTRIDVEIIRALQSGEFGSAIRIARECGLLPAEGSEIGRNREREELEAKLGILGIQIPWPKE